MKSLKYAKKITEEMTAFSQLIDSYCMKVNKEYMKQTLQLLEDIAEGENLDFAKLKQKYIKSSRSDIVESSIDEECGLLDRIHYEGKTYYLDKQNNNTLYDTSSNIIGRYINNQIVFTAN